MRYVPYPIDILKKNKNKKKTLFILTNRLLAFVSYGNKAFSIKQNENL